MAIISASVNRTRALRMIEVAVIKLPPLKLVAFQIGDELPRRPHGGLLGRVRVFARHVKTLPQVFGDVGGGHLRGSEIAARPRPLPLRSSLLLRPPVRRPR